jgi:phage baseplate assembly protein W
MASTFRDLSLTFQSHPGTGDALKRVDVDAVKTSLYNIIFASPFDSPFDPNYGINIRGLLFENINSSIIAVAKRKMLLAITEYEPRCIIDELYINDASDSNSLDIGILFHVIGNPLQQSLNYSMNRAR